MGYFSEQIKKYLAKATPEQLKRDQEILDKYAGIGPTLKEFFHEIDCVQEVNVVNNIASSEYNSLNFSNSSLYEVSSSFFSKEISFKTA